MAVINIRPGVFISAPQSTTTPITVSTDTVAYLTGGANFTGAYTPDEFVYMPNVGQSPPGVTPIQPTLLALTALPGVARKAYDTRRRSER
jgi:hypothetical protein